jgi:uncharacterized DUF497 family protein
MNEPFVYRFTWDPDKADSNQRKHQITFEQAATVLRDPLALSRYDDDLLLIVHTFEEITPNEAQIRIISARAATVAERQQYESG